MGGAWQYEKGGTSTFQGPELLSSAFGRVFRADLHYGAEKMANLDKILILDNEVEARLLDSVLSERGIPHMVVSYYDTAYDGLFQAARGWGHLEAPTEYREEILAIHHDLASPSDEADEE
jgi:hypothetical protein